MQLCKVRDPGGEIRIGFVEGEAVRLFPKKGRGSVRELADILNGRNPVRAVEGRVAACVESVPLAEAAFASPADGQEIWAAGVTYRRSQEARMSESQGASQFYDKVYDAPRPELFLKAAPGRAFGPKDELRIRRDSKWNVPEPELALVVSPKLKIVGYTIGNDMSSRDIEGENPLYLPQAKIYDGSCALGPVVTLADSFPGPTEVTISLKILRGGQSVFEGQTSLERMKRKGEELVEWLGRENTFPDGVILLTGTGIVPPDGFTLEVNDLVEIDITGIGTLRNSIGQRSE